MAGSGGKSALRAIGGRPMLVGAAAAAAVFALTLVPLRKEASLRANPAEDAQTTYLSLLDRIGASEAGPLAEGKTGPGVSEIVGPEAPADRLDRDLFAPARRGSYRADAAENAATPSAPRRPARPRSPVLSAIWIDGPSRQAILNGRPMAEGEEFDGYRVIRIGRDGVILERDGAELRLPWGEES
ncbi:MAG: hypothetical protein JW958_10575 [Candidatus Eisenbacteria bacterium]|nr:hypothetical protein [Candidatus Eisenbacteria bacterium]